jgi:hypothetical protein
MMEQCLQMGAKLLEFEMGVIIVDNRINSPKRVCNRQ